MIKSIAIIVVGVIIICTTVHGQEIPDSLVTAHLPVWESSDSTYRPIEPYTLDPVVPVVYRRGSISTRTVGIGLMIGFGYLSYQYSQKADKKYKQYLHTGNMDEMDTLYAEAKQYDRIVGWLYAGMELSFLFLISTFYE